MENRTPQIDLIQQESQEVLTKLENARKQISKHILETQLISPDSLREFSISAHEYLGGIGVGKLDYISDLDSKNPNNTIATSHAGVRLIHPDVNLGGYDDENETLYLSGSSRIVFQVFWDFYNTVNTRESLNLVYSEREMKAAELSEEVIQEMKYLTQLHLPQALKDASL